MKEELSKLAPSSHTWQASDEELEGEEILLLLGDQQVQLVHQGVLLASQWALGQLYNYECSLRGLSQLAKQTQIIQMYNSSRMHKN